MYILDDNDLDLRWQNANLFILYIYLHAWSMIQWASSLGSDGSGTQNSGFQ